MRLPAPWCEDVCGAEVAGALTVVATGAAALGSGVAIGLGLGGDAQPTAGISTSAIIIEVITCNKCDPRNLSKVGLCSTILFSSRVLYIGNLSGSLDADWDSRRIVHSGVIPAPRSLLGKRCAESDDLPLITKPKLNLINHLPHGIGLSQ